MVEKVDAASFDKLIGEDKPVICDFYADWCGPCKMLAPVVEELSEKYSDKVNFVKVNIDENFELSVRYGIMSIPYVGVFKEGELVDKSIGYSSKSEMDEFISKNI